MVGGVGLNGGASDDRLNVHLAYTRTQRLTVTAGLSVVSKTANSAQTAFDGFDASQVRLERQGDDAVIGFKGSSDTVTLRRIAGSEMYSLEFKGGDALRLDRVFDA
ncbi:MAG TPA: hypothetical protein VLL76_06365 [Candidatus Omnitrophota bacterium]|nr:hypothetical protein [Candidatus Omnitrophota bacterium]